MMTDHKKSRHYKIKLKRDETFRMPKNRSSTTNLDLLARSLRRRQQQLRQRAAQKEDVADELWSLWLDATRFVVTAREFWPAGRDAALALLVSTRREEAYNRLRQVLTILTGFGLHQEAISCLRRASDMLTDHELASQLVELDPPMSLVRSLLPEFRERATQGVRGVYATEQTVEVGRVLGRLLDASPDTTRQPSGDKISGSSADVLEARSLYFNRWHGTETVAGIGYEAKYALWRMLTDDDIESLSLQDLEDIKIVHCGPNGLRVSEHVQAKKRDSDWSIPALQSPGTSDNKVFDSFAEVLLAEPDARLTFATNADLAAGRAPDLVRAADKFSNLSTSPQALEAVILADVRLTEGEKLALHQLAERMRPDLLQRITLPSLLARVKFDTGRTLRELRSELIRRISARLDVSDPAAEKVYYAFTGLLLEAMEQRREFSRTDIDQLIEQAGVQAQAFREAAVHATQVEVLDFSLSGDTSAARYYQGLSSSPADIAAGYDALRPDLLTQIDRILQEQRCCVLRAPSGQGKTTLLYRYAHDAVADAVVIRVHTLDHKAVAEVIELIKPLAHSSVLVAIDNIAGGDRQDWPRALRRLLEMPQVQVLATSREDDWRLAAVSSLEGVVGFVYPKLDQHTAEVIYEGLAQVEAVQLHADHWLEPFQASNGHLMEYVYLLTQGRHMHDLIDEQISGLERRLGQDRTTVLEALRYISTAHRYGGYISRATLIRLLPSTSTVMLGRALRVLQNEFWVRDTGHDHYIGLHQVRSQVVSDVLHEHDPLDETVGQLLKEADADEIAALLESLFYSAPDVCTSAVSVLAARASHEGIRFGVRVAAAIYAAEERRYADQVFRLLEDRGVSGSQALLPVMATLPQGSPVSTLVAAFPEPVRVQVEAVLAALPKRRQDERDGSRFLEGVGPKRLGEWLIAGGDEDIVELLRLLVVSAPQLAPIALQAIDVHQLARRLRTADSVQAPDLLSAIRGADVSTAIRVADELGYEFAVNRALGSLDNCYAIRVDSSVVQAQFLVDLTDGGPRPNEVATELTRTLYALFPAATTCEVTGYVRANMAHPDGTKRIPRENMPVSRHQLAFNQFWLSLASERLGARSIVSVLQTHDEYARVLLNAVSLTYHCLGNPSIERRHTALEAWNQVNAASLAVPYVPHQAGSLVAALVGQPFVHSQPGAQPLDSAFTRVSGAGSNVGRELIHYFSGATYSSANLRDQLAELVRETGEYYTIRAALSFEEKSHTIWRTELPTQIVRLYEAVHIISKGIALDGHRGEAQRLFDSFTELRALAQDLIRELSIMEEGDTSELNLDKKAGVLRQILDEVTANAPGWQGLGELRDIVDDLTTVVATPHPQVVEDYPISPVAIAERLSHLDTVTLFDFKVALAKRDDDARRALLENEVQVGLAARGIEGICRVEPSSPSNPLLESAAIMVHVTDLHQLEKIKVTVREIAFATLPPEVVRLRLLLTHREGKVLPGAFETWRTSGEIPNPYSQMLGLGVWTPVTDVASFVTKLGVTIDQRAHPVAQAVETVRRQLLLLLLRYGQLSAMLAVVNTGWQTDKGVIIRQLNEVVQHMQDLVDKLGQLAVVSNDYPDWQSIAGSALDAVSEHLDWLIGMVLGEADTRDQERIEAQLTEAWTLCDNALYLDRVQPPNTSQSSEAALRGAVAAVTRFAALSRSAMDELVTVANSEAIPAN